MSFINRRDKEITCKLVYFGPAFAGKTTSLEALVKKMSNGKGEKVITLSGADDRTLFFDFLPLTFGKVKDYTVRMNVYSIPGDVIYDSARTLILKGVDGLIFVADSQMDRLEDNLESWKNIQKSLKSHGVDITTVPTALQYNKRDLSNCLPVESLRAVLNFQKIPEFETVATEGKNILECFQSVAHQALKSLS